MSLYKEINEKIHGRLALAGNDETDLLYKYVDRPGVHLEIGTLWGGTAVLAGMAKRNHANARVITIEFMQGGFWDHGDPGHNFECPTYETIIENLNTFGLSEYVTVIKSSSDPLPIDSSVKPVTVFIDGGHSYDACLADWNNVRVLKPEFVIVHDYNTGKHYGVQQVVDEVIRKDEAWVEIEAVKTMIVFKAK